jgi:hypothetical protein
MVREIDRFEKIDLPADCHPTLAAFVLNPNRQL